MSKRLRVAACLTAVLAVLFYLFFQVSKHNVALSPVNAFANDPYDSVGSFGVQFALFTALLTLVRAFRPYQANKALDGQQLLVVRGAWLSCLSVAVTLVADVVAMIRHPAVWVDLPAGYILAALLGGVALFTVLVGWLLHYWIRTMHVSPAKHAWSIAIGLCIVSVLVLALYPESWRQSIGGELFTVLVGIAFLFVPLWALENAIFPAPAVDFEDCIDDLASVYRWVKAHIGPFVICCNLLEKIFGWPFLYPVRDWLNPRKHTWNVAILLGIVIGIGLALGEAFGEGGGIQQVGRFALIASIFIGLECVGVLLGYSLLAKPIGLFRHDTNDTTSWRAS
ncbi:hypothetical protein ccbrp13_07600 [Ktedonobacteria bacterium brp13]|nr:hypothetical protein ccbrp13_07600 [Ktedonobacteria bacterium brp13]